MSDVWIAGIARGHNASVCLLKNGKVVFSIEEERLTRAKYDGGPYAAMMRIKDYTDKLDYLVVAHTQSLKDTAGKVDFMGEDVYTGLARKLGLIDRKCDIRNHPQVIDLSHIHHKLHAACSFYRSGFESAVAVIVDGAGTFIPMKDAYGEPAIGWETESVFQCNYPNNFKTLYKHIGMRGPLSTMNIKDAPGTFYNEPDSHEVVISDRAGIVKVYEAVTQYCGWQSIEAGKTMGLFPYGKPNNKFPKLFDDSGDIKLSNRNFIIPTYPNGSVVNYHNYSFLNYHGDSDDSDVTELENRRDLAYAVQTESQQMVLDLIVKASETTGEKNVVVSGGYGLNCVANYFYLDKLNELGINMYVEPISNDAGTAIGAAMLVHYDIEGAERIDYSKDGLYLGFEYKNDLDDILGKYSVEVSDAEYSDVIKLLRNKNIVALYQGRSENGPRALGNRSLLFDPTFVDGKDWVNRIKRREYFRPFAGSILKEHVHEWFDLRGMEETPYMMYAVNCQPGIEEKIPSIIHVDGTCRIQTVTQEQNFHYYNLIKEFYKETGVPIVFNTSFNLGGDPLVETIEDAIDTLVKSDIEYLYLPEYGKLVYVRN